MPDADGRYLILAEDEELSFVPADGADFDRALGLATTVVASPPHRHLDEAEPSKLTMLGFYLLAGTTSALGLWAIWSLVG